MWRARVTHAGSFLIFLGWLAILAGCNAHSERPSSPASVKEIVAAYPPDIQNVDSVYSYLESLHQRRKFNGIALCWNSDSMSVFTFGKRDFKEEAILEGDDLFQLASLSKPISALGLLLLVDRGLIDLDAEVSEYLYDFPYPQITVRSLLNHTSGLGNYLYVTDSLWNNPDSFMTNSDVYDIIRCEQLPIYYPPFKRFNYCNTNYALIPTLIEETTGKEFTQFMRDELFEPIGMFQSAFIGADGPAIDSMSVKGHYPNGTKKRAFYLDHVLGDKSLASNVFDLLKLYHELKHPSLMNELLIEEATSPQASAGYGRSYGLGWRIAPLPDGDTLVFHNGWWRGFRSYFWMSKREDKLFIALTNSIRGGYLSQEDIWFLF